MHQRFSRMLCAGMLILTLTTLAAAQAITTTAAPDARPPADKTSGDATHLDEVQRQLREQRAEIERLRQLLDEQTRSLAELRQRVERSEQLARTPADAPAVVREATYASAGAAQDQRPAEDRLSRVETQAKQASEAITRQLGNITFSGELRVRAESILGQQNAAPTSDNPAALGNPLSSRNRMRLRARFGARGTVGKDFEWGIRLATGMYPDVNSANQTLTDFFTRKPFALEHAYITYKPSRLPGFQVQAGKFDAPWTRTELAWDAEVMTEGINESYTYTFKKSRLKSLGFVAWQLPMLERNSAFVLGANGRVDVNASRRAGRDLALYGAQVRARIEPNKRSALTFSATDLYFSGTQFITPLQFFGPNVQVPLTFTIPATATTPAQTITTQVSIPREQLVTGNANLGVSTATNNALNRDGRLSSGYNLVDLIGRLDLSHSKQWPVMLLLNFVRNTQAHDVVTAGPGGANLILPNHENNAFWAEAQVGRDVLRLAPRDVVRGDFLLNYTFMRIEKDAVLTPFNFSDIAQQSDARAHRIIAAYAVDPRVTLTFTSIFTERPNGVLGVFGTTPPGSLNRTTKRFQFDTLIRF